MKFDRNSSTVKGWDSIWAILEMEEKEKDTLLSGVQAGVIANAKKREDDESRAGSLNSSNASLEAPQN